MQYIPCNSALLAQETLFLTQKKVFFLSTNFQKVRKSLQIFISRQNNVCQGLKLSSESKLFCKVLRAYAQLLPPCNRQFMQQMPFLLLVWVKYCRKLISKTLICKIDMYMSVSFLFGQIPVHPNRSHGIEVITMFWFFLSLV